MSDTGELLVHGGLTAIVQDGPGLDRTVMLHRACRLQDALDGALEMPATGGFHAALTGNSDRPLRLRITDKLPARSTGGGELRIGLSVFEANCRSAFMSEVQPGRWLSGQQDPSRLRRLEDQGVDLLRCDYLRRARLRRHPGTPERWDVLLISYPDEAAGRLALTLEAGELEVHGALSRQDTICLLEREAALAGAAVYDWMSAPWVFARLTAIGDPQLTLAETLETRTQVQKVLSPDAQAKSWRALVQRARRETGREPQSAPEEREMVADWALEVTGPEPDAAFVTVQLAAMGVADGDPDLQRARIAALHCRSAGGLVHPDTPPVPSRIPSGLRSVQIHRPVPLLLPAAGG